MDKCVELRSLAEYLRRIRLPVSEREAIQQILSAALTLDRIADREEAAEGVADNE